MSEKPTYDELLEIAQAAVKFHRSLMSDWAAPRQESGKTLKLSDALERAYMPHWPDISRTLGGTRQHQGRADVQPEERRLLRHIPRNAPADART